MRYRRRYARAVVNHATRNRLDYSVKATYAEKTVIAPISQYHSGLALLTTLTLACWPAAGSTTTTTVDRFVVRQSDTEDYSFLPQFR